MLWCFKIIRKMPSCSAVLYNYLSKRNYMRREVVFSIRYLFGYETIEETLKIASRRNSYVRVLKTKPF